MRVLSLFDGMSCGMLAFMAAGINVDRYVAFEIDKYAVQTSSHNFPMIEHRGDVFQADFTEFRGFDFVVGGSPCTYWSIAQKNNRETEASGMGWELFCQYVRAVKEAQPMYFIYENNKSMSKAIRESITETFGFEPICINSALVSAQNRQRLYWVGKRNPDGTYSKVHVDQPEDRGILLRDVLDSYCWLDKAYTIDSNYHKTLGQQGFDRQSGRRKMAAEPVVEPFKVLTEREMDYMVRSTNGKYSDRWAYLQKPGQNDKAVCITANISKGVPYNIVAQPVTDPIRVGAMPRPNGELSTSQAFRVYSADGKTVNITAGGGGAGGKTGLYAVPVESKTVTGAIPEIVDKYGYLPEMFNAYNRAEITDKAPTLSTGSMVTSSCAVNRFERIDGAPCVVFAEAVDWDEEGKPTKAISGADGKTYPVYQVKDGYITIKDKQYPIKLADGFYIIRKLTVSECKRLQTVPEWYEFPVSDTQAYKMLGNGWTVLVISWLIQATQADVQEEEQLSLFNMGVM